MLKWARKLFGRNEPLVIKGDVSIATPADAKPAEKPKRRRPKPAKSLTERIKEAVGLGRMYPRWKVINETALKNGNRRQRFAMKAALRRYAARKLSAKRVREGQLPAPGPWCPKCGIWRRHSGKSCP